MKEIKKNKLKLLSLLFTSAIFVGWLWSWSNFTWTEIVMTTLPVLGAFIGNIIHVKQTWNK